MGTTVSEQQINWTMPAKKTSSLKNRETKINKETKTINISKSFEAFTLKAEFDILNILLNYA